LARGRLEHRVEQVDGQGLIRFAAEEPFEDVIDLGINPRHHDRSSRTSRTAAGTPAPRPASTCSSFSRALPRWGKGKTASTTLAGARRPVPFPVPGTFCFCSCLLPCILPAQA